MDVDLLPVLMGRGEWLAFGIRVIFRFRSLVSIAESFCESFVGGEQRIPATANADPCGQ